MDQTLAQQYRLLDTITTEGGILSVGSARMILFSARAYVFLVRSIYQHAPHAVKFLLYDVGYQTGEEFMGTIRGMSAERESLMGLAIEIFKQAGYGDFELIEFDPGKPLVRVRETNLFEASLCNELGIYRTPRTVDHHSRGLFAGFFSQLLGVEVVCEETACEGRGDGNCEFVIMPFV